MHVTLNRPSFVIPVLMSIGVCLVSPVFSDAVYVSPFCSAGQSVWISGNALDVDYTFGDFILKDRGRLYVVLAKQATVQLPASKFGRLSSVKEGCFVRVFGEQLSSRTIYASLIIVMDETGAFQDQRPNSYFLNENGWLGDVICVFVAENKFKFRISSREYVVIIGPETTINGFKRRTGIYSISPTDRLRVIGSVEKGNTIKAKSITFIEPVDPTPITRLRSERRDVITGTVASLPSSFGGKLKLITTYGMREAVLNSMSADLKKLSNTFKDNCSNLTVRVYGTWQDRILLADRVEVIEAARSETHSKVK